MRNRFISPSRRHQLLVSLAPHGVQILHFQRGWLGWKQAHTHQADLPQGDNYLQCVQSTLKECSQTWRIPAGSDVCWVLAGDIIGVLPPMPASALAEPGALLPFAPGSVLTQLDRFGQGEEKSLLWIHKDWATEMERISSACQLRAVEIFSRAQLFQALGARSKNHIRMVLEGAQSDYFLHIFAANGAILRSCLVEYGTLGDGLVGLLNIELASLPENHMAAAKEGVTLLAPAEHLPAKEAWPHAVQTLPTNPPATLLERLWRSGLEGIVLQATHNELIQKINLWSMAAAVLGLAALATMLWHDGRLERQIEDTHEDLRKQAPKIEAAKLLKAKTLWMADVVRATEVLAKDTQAATALPEVLAVFPPPPAALLYLRLDGRNVALAGTGDDTAVQWLHDHPLAQYQPFTDMPVPEFLAEQNIAIHLQTAKQAPSLEPAPAAVATPTQPEKATP